MWYKARLESAEAEGRLMQQRLADQQEQIHQLIANNNLLTQANQRGANLITMKHEAGTMFGQVTDRVADLFGTMRREIPEVAAFVPDGEDSPSCRLRASHAARNQLRRPDGG